MRSKFCGLLAIAAMTCCGTAQAQTIQFAFGVNGVLMNSFDLPVIGGSVPVTLYMLDNGGNLAGYQGVQNPTLTGNLRANGLTGFGVRLTSSNPLSSRVANAAAIQEFNPIVTSGTTGNDQSFGFNFVTTKQANATTGIANLAAQRLGDGGIDPPVPPQYVGQVPVTDATPAAPAGRVELATFTISTPATVVPFSSATFTLSDPDTTNGNTALGNFNNPGQNGGLVLDPVGGQSFLFGQTFTVNVGVIPEPSSMILGGMALAGMCGFKLRRKKVKTEETAAV
jgi:hypothetical protein